MVYVRKDNFPRLLLLSALVILVRVTSNSAPGKITVGPWEPIFKGVEHARGEADAEEPRLQKVNALRVDLCDPNIVLFTTPSNGPTPGETDRQTGGEFIMTYGVQAAVNTHFYYTGSDIRWNADLIGLSISEGEVVSAAESLPYGGSSLLISQNNFSRFQVTSPSSDLSWVWTAVEAWPFFLVNGVNYGDPSEASVHPRTAIGLTWDHRYLIMITIDGRQPDYSDGATFWETAQWLIRFGAYNGLNLDGGGSTHMWISNGDGGAIVLNSPSEDRAVGSHLGIFAAPLTPSLIRSYIYADFEYGYEGTFSESPGYSGSTYGIDASLSSADAVNMDSFSGDWSQRLVIIDDGIPNGGWFVRHVSGPNASRSDNVIRPTNGFVGLWAKTSTAGIELSLAIDNTDNVTADRGVRRVMITDGQWHLYEWDLQDDDQWEGWFDGDGLIDTVDFTIDSIQIFGPDVDATIFIDVIGHNSNGSLIYLFSNPGDFEPDGDVDFADYAQFASHWPDAAPGSWADLDGDNDVDLQDLAVLVENWLVGFDVEPPPPPP
jgi:exopolysaccharide biosynthesis protein